ncbi:hypothetical protein A7X93_01350 [Stenotrophomonas maltophilia]|uniref:hypothetical protein n=1 Tax=Stenotrophomonas maltophilia TaxID=40324 RepID=UPI000DA7BD72|nr:hypothetical protein [Stenotrophomonas maltophilia]MDZ5840517.1 hypothetical protein [Stenotrophomonas maltophilia]PZT31823.1 hypothetical protein A7X93_01350 [Stenotrophomonas maltophilia]HDS1556794.1 hypothetical protein [Stenotrophomonas maltophilia]HEL5052636.1 hypothetical protein [Stenotrophomonas maltophilia]
MKQEHRLVAELYRFIAPFIEISRDFYLCLDGQAAGTATKAGRFLDSNIPDLWFTLVGATEPLLIEAKILDKGKALVMQSQLAAWRTSGTSAYKPRYWVAANREFNEFYFWSHHHFLPILDNSKATGNIELTAPKQRIAFNSISELALHILREA